MAQNKLSASLTFLFVALIMGAAPITQAQHCAVGSIVGGPISSIRINGTIFCSLDGRPGVLDGVAIPPFAYALVQLQCGRNVVMSTRTNANGEFTLLGHMIRVLTQLINNQIVVKTPLSNCNAKLPPVGGLVSRGLISAPDSVIGDTLNLLPVIFDYVPVRYHDTPSVIITTISRP